MVVVFYYIIGLVGFYVLLLYYLIQVFVLFYFVSIFILLIPIIILLKYKTIKIIPDNLRKHNNLKLLCQIFQVHYGEL